MKRSRITMAAILALCLIAVFVRLFLPGRSFAPRVKKTAVTLYFANRTYIESGNENIAHLIPERRFVEYEGGGLAGATLRALQAGPRSAKATRVIRPDLQVLDVKMEKGVALCDLARANLSGGSLEERILLEGVVWTLTAIPGVKAVRFLIDGQPAETLMGHFAVDKPLRRKDL